jgi:hypothetical protein
MGEPSLDAVLRSAAELQRVVPDAVLVGGAAAALWAHHRDSFDHDHVLADLSARYFDVLEAVEATDGWVTSVRASSPPLTLLGRLGGVEAGLRQLRRTVPLEVERVAIDDKHQVVVPTLPEMLRVKAYLVVLRNQVRDYLDVVALAGRLGAESSVAVLLDIDRYYTDRSGEADSVLTSLVQRLSEPNPRDSHVTTQLDRYRRLDPHWQSWPAVVAACHDLADGLLRSVEGR